ncbi:MAG: T9SS type A sorting domain-containing protein [Bacteroidales bacterium]
MKNKQSLLFLLYLCLGTTFSTMAQQSINTSGGEVKGNNGSISYSVGQVFTQYASNPQGSISEGVQQSYELSCIAIEGIQEIKLQAHVYPNPVQTKLFLSLENYDFNGCYYVLYHLNGKQIGAEKLQNSTTEIAMDTYAAGTYLIKVYSDSKALKTFKVIKK